MPYKPYLTWEGGMMAPQNVFHHCAETSWRRKLKLCHFKNQSMEHKKKVIFSSLGYPVLPKQPVC